MHPLVPCFFSPILFASLSLVDSGSLLLFLVVVGSSCSLVANGVSVLCWPGWCPVVGAVAGVAGGVVVFVVPGAVSVSVVSSGAVSVVGAVAAREVADSVSVEETACADGVVAFLVAGGVAVLYVVDVAAFVIAAVSVVGVGAVASVVIAYLISDAVSVVDVAAVVADIAAGLFENDSWWYSHLPFRSFSSCGEILRARVFATYWCYRQHVNGVSLLVCL